MVARKTTRKRSPRKRHVPKLGPAERLLLRQQFVAAVPGMAGVGPRGLFETGVATADRLVGATPGWIVNLGGQVKLLVEMLSDWWRGSFAMPGTSIAAIVGALIYFLDPFDLVPDELPILGLLDDATVITGCIKLIQADLRRYAIWRRVDVRSYGL